MKPDKSDHRHGTLKKSPVRFASVEFNKIDPDATLPAKFDRLLKMVELKRIAGGKMVALKMHMGK